MKVILFLLYYCKLQSAVFEIKGNAEKSRFVGQWVSPFLLLGVYNKLVKIAGSDRVHE